MAGARWQRRRGGILGAACALVVGSLPAPAATVFRHEGFAQLARGEFGNAGQNIFVSRRGELKLINWFDLDRDGFPDLVINNDHSPYENSDSLVYYQHPVDGFRSLLPTVAGEHGAFEKITWLRAAQGRAEFLPSMGGGRSVIVDLERDGWPEIIFANFIHGSTHDHFPVFVYWGTENGYTPVRRSDFPSESATGVAVADLDGNGRLDLVVANMGREDDTVLASAGPKLNAAPPIVGGATARSRIYWQGEDGFSLERATDLPTRHAVDVKVADLDGDGRQDLVFLQGGDWPSVRVFFGAADGFAAERVSEAPVNGRGFVEGIAGELAIGDLDADGRLDLAVAAGGAEVELLFNGGRDLAAWKRGALPAQTPLSVVAADLNRDGRADLAVAGFMAKRGEYRTKSSVYWNSGDGLDAARRTELPSLGATALRAGDINGDGFIDLAVANSQDGASFDVPSYLYWGAADGFAAERRTELTSFGAVSVAIGDLNRDRVPDLFIANRNSGRSYSGGPIDSFVWWGNPHRQFNNAVLTRIPLTTGFSSSAGDLFDDGAAAIAFTEFGHVAVARLGRNRQLADIRRWPMPSRGFSTTLADLDRDGRLDLIVGSIDAEGRGLSILRGSDDGFAAPVHYQPGIPILATAVTDLDGDGRLEIILGGRGGWLACPVAADGAPELNRAQRVPSDHQVQRLTVADLDNDGRPEVIATHYREMTGRRNAIDSAIYWNRGGRFSYEERTGLPTFGSHWVSVADTRGRGALDVIFSNYHGETSRTVGLFVYSPDERGAYAAERRLVLPSLSGAANFVADLDADGFQDIVSINHTGPNLTLGLKPKSGVHGVGSTVYWGAADGFDPERRTTVPSHGPHKITNAELGDILRRRPFETYTSPAIETALNAGEYELVVSGSFAGRSSCGAAVQFDDGQWNNVPRTAASAAEQRFRVSCATPARRLRYRLEIRTAGAGTGPIVTAISLNSP